MSADRVVTYEGPKDENDLSTEYQVEIDGATHLLRVQDPVTLDAATADAINALAVRDEQNLRVETVEEAETAAEESGAEIAYASPQAEEKAVELGVVEQLTPGGGSGTDGAFTVQDVSDLAG